MKKIILLDIDHTISDAFHRDPMIGCVPWDNYHAASINDLPAKDFVEFISNFYGKDYRLIGLTSRPEKFRDLTIKWLCRHDVYLEDLWMRPDADYRTAAVVKIDLCAKKLGESWREKILCLIDDNDRVIEAFRGERITCMQIFNKRGEHNHDAARTI